MKLGVTLQSQGGGEASVTHGADVWPEYCVGLQMLERTKY